MANLKRFLNYSVLFFRSFGLAILFSYVYPNERIEVTSGDTFAMTYIKYHMKVSCLISFHESGDESRILNIHFHASYFFKNSVNQLTGTYRILNTS